MNRPSLNRVAAFALDAGINFALPLAIYDRVAPHGGDVVALLASSGPPLLWSLAEFARRRRVDALSILAARFLQLRENLVTALVGLVFLGSAAVRRPLIFQLARAGLARKAPHKVAAFEAKRDLPQFRRVITLMTLVWGFGLLASSGLACALVQMLSIHDYLLVSPFVSYGFMGALTVWIFWYQRLVERRAAADDCASVEGGW